MTKELKQKAERFRKKYKQDIIDNDDFEMLDNFDVNVERAYIAGATENGIQWHNLRKDPNDLPKEEGDYFLCLYDNETKSIFYEVFGFAKRYADREDWYVESMLWTIDDVVAWCEIPQFKE